MCDQQTFDAISGVIGEFVHGEKLFTAFDVTKRLRQTHGHISHNEVRNEVHRMLNNGMMGKDYVKDQHSFDAGGYPVTAFVFHPSSVDVSEYDPSDLDGTSQPSTAQKDTISNPYTDARGRLCVPNFYTKMCGWTPGDEVFVYSQKNTKKRFAIGKSPEFASLPYRVDRSGNIRISAYCLKTIGFDPTSGVIWNYDPMSQAIVVQELG